MFGEYNLWTVDFSSSGDRSLQLLPATAMDLPGSATIFLVFCLVFLLVWGTRPKAKNLPPGPTPLPFVGNLLQLKVQNLVANFREMSKKYGPIFTVYFGSDQAVVLFGYDLVKKVLVDRGDEFLNRGSFPSADKTNRGLGIIMSNGERWLQLRRFSLTTMRNFGMGKKNIEERIQEEAEYLMKELRAKNGQPFNPAVLFSCATGNVVSHILLGERFDYNDPEYRRILCLLVESFRLESSTAGQLYNIFPRILDYLPGPHQTFFKNLGDIQVFIAQKVKDHERSLDPNAPRDFIDSFLLKMEQEQQNPKTEFTRENLNMAAYDIFIAGTETTSTTLRYILMILLEHPAVQEKIQKEIDQVIGQERLPAMKDRLEMPYTEAVLHEAQRLLDLVPLGFPRVVKHDTEIEGYFIPKGRESVWVKDWPGCSYSCISPPSYKVFISDTLRESPRLTSPQRSADLGTSRTKSPSVLLHAKRHPPLWWSSLPAHKGSRLS